MQKEPVIDDNVGYDESGHYCPALGQELQRGPLPLAPPPSGAAALADSAPSEHTANAPINHSWNSSVG